MIHSEVVALLIAELRAMHAEMVRSPKGRDGFALGEIFGWGACVEIFEERLKELIDQRAESDPVDRPFTTGSEREYQF